MKIIDYYKIRILSKHKIISLIQSKIDNFYIIPEFLLMFPGKLKYYLINWAGNKILFPIIINELNYYFFKFNKILCPTGPIIIDGTSSNRERFQITDEFEKYLSTIYHHKFISITQLPTLKPILTTPHISNNKWKLSYSYSIILNLSNDIKKIFNDLKKRTKYTLRKFTNSTNEELISNNWAKNVNFTIKISKNYRDLEYFYRDRDQIKQKIILEGSEPSRFLEKSILDENFKRLSKAGLIKLFLIFDENKEIGTTAIILTINKPIIRPLAYYSAGTSSEIGRKLGLPTILQWFIINWLKNNGFQFYDLGGISSKPNHGPSLFKRGFGGKVNRGWTLTKQTRLVRFLNYLIHVLRIKKLQLFIKLKIL